MDVLVVGGGPAGMALAAAANRLGLTTGLVEPVPERPWSATYGMWSRELPDDVPDSVIAARAMGRAIALTEHDLGWEYAVLDVPAYHSHLMGRLDGVHIHAGRAVGSPERGVVALADGSRLRASVVVDAGGRAQPLGPGSSRVKHAAQTAFGVVLDEHAAIPLVAPGQALFMDWRADHGETGWPTFLYVIPLGAGRVLAEETSLARRPGLPVPVLRRRLHARLAHHGVSLPEDAVSETVSFPVDSSRHAGRGVVGFGAAAPLIHPATGYSVATSLRLAPQVAAAIASGLHRGPDEALAAARDVVWPLRARLIHRFRLVGLEALLRMPPADVPGFFERFFSLPDAHRWSYLTGRDDVPGVLATMGSLFRAADGPLRRHLVASAVRRPLPSNDAL